jgi:hypothetical protein
MKIEKNLYHDRQKIQQAALGDQTDRADIVIRMDPENRAADHFFTLRSKGMEKLIPVLR